MEISKAVRMRFSASRYRKPYRQRMSSPATIRIFYMHARLQLETMKPEVKLQANNIHSTIVIFDSARPVDPVQKLDGPLAKDYSEAQKFATLGSEASQPYKLRDYVR